MSTRTDSSSSKDDYISSGDRWLKLVSGELESGARNLVRRQEPTEFKRKHSHRGEHESDDEYDRRKTHSRRTHHDSSKEAQSEYDGRRSRHMTSYSNDNTKYRRSDGSTDSKSKVATKTSKSSSSEDDDDSAGEWVEAPAFSTASNQVPNLSPSAFTGKKLNISRISAPSRPKKGPTLPSPADIQLMNSELNDESLEDMRAARLYSRRASEAQYLGAAENLLQGGASDPSDPRDRKIEKRQLEHETRREYVRARSPGGVDEVGDDELFDGAVGGGSSSKLSEVAARRAEKDRIKKEKREAFYREKDAERRKRWEEMQAREKKTIDMLRELARQKFGDVP